MADDYTVKASDSHGFVTAFSNIADEFTAELDDELKEAMHDTGRVTRAYLRGNSPRDSGDYAKDWRFATTDRDGHHEVVVKNEHHYQLTHLLEDGHNIRNEKGGPVLGWVEPAKPDHHIERAYEVGKAELERRLGVRL